MRAVSQALLQSSAFTCQLDPASSSDYSTHDWSTSTQVNQSERNTDYWVIEEAHGPQLVEHVLFWQRRKSKKEATWKKKPESYLEPRLQLHSASEKAIDMLIKSEKWPCIVRLAWQAEISFHMPTHKWKESGERKNTKKNTYLPLHSEVPRQQQEKHHTNTHTHHLVWDCWLIFKPAASWVVLV